MIEVGVISAVAAEFPFIIYTVMVQKDWPGGANSDKEKQKKRKKDCHLLLLAISTNE